MQKWSLGLQFARWKLFDRLEWLGIMEFAGIVLIMLMLIPFPRFDVCLIWALYINLASWFIFFFVACAQKTQEP